MRSLARWGTVAVYGVVLVMVFGAVPVVADPPDMVVFVWDDPPQEWTVDNPCTDQEEEVRLYGPTTIREILFGYDPGTGEPGTETYERRITAVSHEIVGDAPWSGRGTDTGVELAQGETAVWQIMVTNSDSGQKFRFFGHVHRNANTGEWNSGGAIGLTCVIP